MDKKGIVTHPVTLFIIAMLLGAAIMYYLAVYTGLPICPKAGP